MSVLIKNVIPGSPADKAGYKPGTYLESINGEPINDVLDYMFYADGEAEFEGLEFDSFLMDKKRGCGNNCEFCFIDQLPPRNVCKVRDALYFKDDDSRLSFLQGNYITLTNLTEHDVDRIIRMHTPVNISVHTTNPDLRVKMMGNPKAGESLKTLYRFAEAGISMNCQLVLCPGINDGEELVRTLWDLSKLNKSGSSGSSPIESIACVPVGLTKFRQGLPLLRTFNKSESTDIIKTIGAFGNVYAADELYLVAGIDIPEYEHYGTFPQYENGVGMLAYMKQGFMDYAGGTPLGTPHKEITIVTGTAAFPLISQLVKTFKNVRVFAIRNDFFGHSVTVSGLLTGGDIIHQLLPQKELLGEELLIGANTLNSDGLFLDDITPAEIAEALGRTVKIVEPDGGALFKAVANTWGQ